MWFLLLAVGDAAPIVGTTTLVIRGFQSGLLVTRGLGVAVPVVISLDIYPDPFQATATALVDPFSATSSGMPDPFQGTATVTVDPFMSTSRLKGS